MNVANDVGELKRQSQIFRQRFCRGIAITKYPDADQTNHRSHAVAVHAQIAESAVEHLKFGASGAGVGAFLNIHAGAISQLVEQFNRNFVAALGVGKCQQHGIVGGMTRFGAVKRVQPGFQPLPPFVSREG